MPVFCFAVSRDDGTSRLPKPMRLLSRAAAIMVGLFVAAALRIEYLDPDFTAREGLMDAGTSCSCGPWNRIGVSCDSPLPDSAHVFDPEEHRIAEWAHHATVFRFIRRSNPHSGRPSLLVYRSICRLQEPPTTVVIRD
jgi:hypothetical protein